MSFTRFSKKRRSQRTRQVSVPSERNEEKSLEYDGIKNCVLDIENGLNDLRKKFKSVKKDERKSPYSYGQIQEHVRTHIHTHVGALNKCLSMTYKEVVELNNSLQIKDSDIRSLESDLKGRDDHIAKLEYELSSAETKRANDLKTQRLQAEETENSLQTKVKSLNQQLQDKDGELTGLQQQLQERETAIGRVGSDVIGLRQQLHDKENAIGSLRNEKEDLRAKKEESEKRADALDTAKRNLEVENSHLQKKSNDELQKRENEINRLKVELQKLHENYKLHIQQKQVEMQSFLDDELQKRDDYFKQQIMQLIQQKDEEIRSWQTEAERRQNNIQTLINQREEEKQGKEEERKQKDDALTRLSAIAGDRLRNNNPGITDLSDPNRPMKIAEKFTEMYDNDWTDSMEALEDLCIPEDQGVEMLLHFLTDSYEECGRIVQELDCHLERAVMVTGSDDGSDQSGSNLPNPALPAEITKPIKDLRRKLTDNSIETLQKKITQHLKEKRNLSDDHLSACKKFVDDCIKYSWMMQIQDPPVYIEWEFEHASKIDTNVLRSYTKAGTLVDVIVWPVLYLHKDGPVLNKGVVQPMQQPIPATEL